MSMKSWKTTLAGIAYVGGKTLQNITNGPAWLYTVGQLLEQLGVALGFLSAKDYNATGGNTK